MIFWNKKNFWIFGEVNHLQVFITSKMTRFSPRSRSQLHQNIDTRFEVSVPVTPDCPRASTNALLGRGYTTAQYRQIFLNYWRVFQRETIVQIWQINDEPCFKIIKYEFIMVFEFYLTFLMFIVFDALNISYHWRKSRSVTTFDSKINLQLLTVLNRVQLNTNKIKGYTIARIIP